MILLLVRGQAIEPEILFRHLFVASLLAIPIFLIVWAVISVALAPLFAVPATKEAHYAVRFRRYWPKDQFVRLEFQNEQLADIVQNTYSPPSNHRSKLKSGAPRF
jgi:hypothetical protein